MPETRPQLLRRDGSLLRYLVAVAVVVAVTVLRIPLAPLLGNSVPFTLYFPAVVVAGWFGGFGPGLAATLLSGYCAKTWFFPPYGSFSLDNWPAAFRLLVFLLTGVLTSFLCGLLHRRTAELEREKKLLEAKVKDRTQHLERSLQDMEVFSYTASHDLRAPLRWMRGYAEILRKDYADVLDEKGRGHLQRIQDAATRLGQLIDDLLQFAKVSGSAAEVEPTPLQAAVAKLIASLPHFAPGEIDLSYERCVHPVLANQTLLQQAIQNLVDNAVKFVAPGVRPKIRLWSEQRDGHVRLWVEDNGIGIAPEDQKRLFQLFSRAAPGHYSGTGIGLAIVDRAVAKMNGRAGVESEPGQGSRFWIELPAA
jgi:signal transduction histidine kinase